MLKKYISREPDINGNVAPVDNTDGATISVASVMHQDVDPELGEVPDLEGYRQREGVRDSKLHEELSEDQQCVLKDLVWRYPDVFTDMPGAGSYIDDIVIFSDIWEDHLRTLKELFGSLRKAKITVRPNKCLLGASRIEFLGHQVGADVVTVVT